MTDSECWARLISNSNVFHLSRYVGICYCFSIYRFRTSVGRGRRNDIRLSDPNLLKMTSTHHAMLVQVGKGCLLIDTSLNGSYVNSLRVKRAWLKSGDVIRFGKKPSPNYTFVGQSTKSFPHVPPSTSTLLSVLKCPLCDKFMSFPAELSPCSHLFCHECLSGKLWESCPRCHLETNSYKLTVKFNLVDIISNVLKLVLTDSEYSTYLVRHSTWKAKLDQCQSQLVVLEKKFQECRNSQLDPFLLISQTWTEFERLKFKRGIEKYSFGEVREYFCWLVRLTAHWVQFDANSTDLQVAAQNLQLSSASRDSLLRFIYSSA